MVGGKNDCSFSPEGHGGDLGFYRSISRCFLESSSLLSVTRLSPAVRLRSCGPTFLLFIRRQEILGSAFSRTSTFLPPVVEKSL